MSGPRTPRVLTIAGSDSGGGAGIQADLRTFVARGVYGASAITAVTAQSARRVITIHAVPPAVVRAQIDVVLRDLGADAVKIGMLPSAAAVRTVVAALRAARVRHVVVDPVLRASSGRPLTGSAALAELRTGLVPLATVLTPNLAEAAALVGFPVRDPADMEAAARALVAMGARAVVVTGGHLAGAAVDLLLAGGRLRTLRAPRVPGPSPHGTGCTFAAAVAAELARGASVTAAVRAAKRYTTRCIRRARRLGGGPPLLTHVPRRS